MSTLPEFVEQVRDLTFRWQRTAKETFTKEIGWQMHQPSQLCFLPGGSTTAEVRALCDYVDSLSAPATVPAVAEESQGPPANDRQPGVSPDGPPLSKPPRTPRVAAPGQPKTKAVNDHA